MKINFNYPIIRTNVIYAVAIVSAVVHPSLGWSDTSANELRLEEIIVTAQKRQESLQNVPISVNVFSGDELSRFSFSEPRDLQFATPGLRFPLTAGITTPYIRGRGTNFAGIGLENPVAIYIDEAYQQSIFSFNSFLDISQVEVLKGPQGTLYGRNATGGAILITTADPTQEFEGYVEAGIGNLGHGTGEAMLNVPVSDTLAMRFVANWEEYEGYVDNAVDGSDHGDTRRLQGRGKVLWQPTERFSALLKGEYQESERGYIQSLLYDGFQMPTGLDFDETIQTHEGDGGPGGENDEKTWLANLKLTYETDKWSIVNVTSYRDMDFTTCVDNDYRYPRTDVFCTNAPGVGSTTDETFSNEIRLTTSLDGRLNYLVGASYQDSDAVFVTALRGLLGGEAFNFVPIFVNSLDITSTAFYGEVYYQFTDQLKLTLGGRYTKDEKELKGDNNQDLVILTFVGTGALLPLSFVQDDTWESFTPRVVLNYETDRANYYFSYNEGFKSGGYNSPAVAPQISLEPEEIKGYELGAKIDVFDGRGRINLAVFYSEITDVQVATINPAGVGVTQENAGEAEAKGLEASIDFQVTSDLSVSIGGMYLDSEFKSYPDAAVFGADPTTGAIVPTFVDLDGTDTLNSPKLSGNLSATYSMGLSSGWSSDVTLLGYYTDDYLFNAGAGGPLGYDESDSYTVWNLTGKVYSPDQKFTLTLYAYNLFDEEYYERIQTVSTTPGFEALTGGAWGTQALPRMYGAKVKYRF